ncbi:MAG: DUF2339 domain-containing protein, partial [Desulfobacteraceae bacterium]|nr:DUF2339 domain-containing protein [Desulfobacteraceae bacterium]
LKIKNLEQWLSASPVLSIFLLLAAAFSVSHPYLPHAGMATMVCFLILTLFLSNRIQFQPPAVIGLLAAVFAQAVWILNPGYDHLAFAGVVWSFSLFAVALPAPFLLHKDVLKFKKVFNVWALFEVFQGIFVIYCAYRLWDNDYIKWLPLGLAICKLPGVVVLLKKLDGKIQRNSILAFHGGTLLFYISMLPVLVLDYGWIGLTFVFESAALLWLNRRIIHPGLRWVALIMAPAGLAILLYFIPDLKAHNSQPVFNTAILAVFLSLVGLAGAVKWSTFPERKLGRLDLKNYFIWLLIGTGFYFLNLIISDVFSGTGQRFQIFPGHDFVHSFSYGLVWAAFGALIWKVRGMNQVMRFTGFTILCLGAGWIILLPIINSGAVAKMPPLFNISLAAFIPLIGLLVLVFLKEPRDNFEGRTKNVLLVLLLTTVFMFIETQLGTLFQTGMNYIPLIAQTWTNALAASFFWIIYGLLLLLWQKQLDKPFRLAGLILILAGIIKSLVLPFRFRTDFSGMTPILNFPSLVWLFILACLVYLIFRNWKEPWPLDMVAIKSFWGLVLGISSFIILNIEIASAFAVKGKMFSMMSQGSLAMQLAYSIGWMLFAVSLLIVGIKWETVRVRWAGLILLVATSVKIFILDLWKLGQLYRVGSFVGLAVVLILVSFLYQRFLSEGKKDEA